MIWMQILEHGHVRLAPIKTKFLCIHMRECYAKKWRLKSVEPNSRDDQNNRRHDEAGAQKRVTFFSARARERHRFKI